MADLFSVRAPLVLRHPDGRDEVLAAVYPHPDGVMIFRLYWHQQAPEEGIHVLHGTLRGEGPWRIGDHRLRVLGCQGTDGELAVQWEAWQAHVESPGAEYPPPPLMAAIARRLGAQIPDLPAS